jgi:acetolactate synthase I/II/III large subunit
VASAADVIARRLFEAGCRHAFGIPGGEVLRLVKGLTDNGIAFTLAKHENAAGFMAEGTWHASGAPAVLVATLGPGVANAVNVIANAYQDRVPLVFLTGCVDEGDALSFTHQIFDHRALLDSITKATFTAVDGCIDTLIDKAVAIALDDQPGPVMIDVPIAVANAEQPDSAPVRRARPTRGAPPAGAELERARAWLGEAERPLIIAGLDVLAHGAESTLAGFVERHGMPLLTTYKAKGVLAEDHTLSLGAAGLSPKADALVLELLAKSDLIVLAGYDPIEMRAGWRNPWPAKTRVIELGAIPNTHYMHQAGLSFIGDIGAGLAALSGAAGESGHWPAGEPTATRAALRQAFAPGADWGPAALIEVARRVLPREVVATVDTGAHRILFNQMWHCYAPRTLLQSTGLCTMGCALPLAMGYKKGRPGRTVVAFVGDGCLEMVLGELATLRDLGLPIIVVVFVDASLALIDLKQRNLGYANAGVDFGATDFAAVAQAFGIHGEWADDRESLETALSEALARKESSVVACRIGARAYDGRI